MTDNFKGRASGIDSPATRAAASIRSDTVDLPNTSTGLYIGTGGDLKVTMAGGDVVTFPSVPAGAVLPIRVSRVWLTGSTASGVLALWN